MTTTVGGTKQTSSLASVLQEFREIAQSPRELGDKFERLIASFLTKDPTYGDRFSDVWLWTEWPRRGNRTDTGIDLVAEVRDTGEFCAIQCKFYDPAYTLQKADIDSFFTESGKKPFTSRLIVSTTDKWSKHAEAALEDQTIPVTRLGIPDLEDSPIDWSQFSLQRPELLTLRAKKTPRPHQVAALKAISAGFSEHDRGRLIMACGTGKTFTSLKVAEQIAADQTKRESLVLFLVPSISLLSQTVREWTIESATPMRAFAVCSDPRVGERKVTEDISVRDLAIPATTDSGVLQRHIALKRDDCQLTVVFSTYQSIDVLSRAQKRGLPEFDLIICDEAHRTTGVTLSEGDESHFVKVHNKEFLKSKRRLYMTATPRIYTDTAKSKAKEGDATLASMDDPSIYGPEFHRLGFGEAVSKGLLSDYKVMVLAVDEKHVSKIFQRQLATKDKELTLEDVVKITGCWNGLAKRIADDPDDNTYRVDPQPMHRAVAFSQSIKASKRFTALFADLVKSYAAVHSDGNEDYLDCEVEHVDGTDNAMRRGTLLDWLREPLAQDSCHILSNARCLSEGVDVPALDAVLFLNPRNSIVDVVQSVGRVMRKAEGKKYGYVILPIGIPADMPPEEALKDNKKYKVVWQVLQALRAHDDRFNALINQVELNKQRPGQIQVIGVGGGNGADATSGSMPKPVQAQLAFPHIEEWRDAIYAKLVQKCGDRRYWESWAKDVAKIAEGHISRIKALVQSADKVHKEAFDEFLTGLRRNLNPGITSEDAIEMLAQHLVTRPVFDALFEHYSFIAHNPVSQAMQKMLTLLDAQQLEKDTARLGRFYASVRERAAGIDNAEGRQRVIAELYDTFFREAFPRMAQRLGIVYTPVEVVDFIVHSADRTLREEFGVGLTDKDVHILDPFTGTGTFIVRLLQSGLVHPSDLERKYKQELHANEIVLLAYYIAAINIEETYHGLAGGDYQSFEGIVLTDTFQLGEEKQTLSGLKDRMLPENSDRATKQKACDIRVVMSNPPYEAQQLSENDSNKATKYPVLDQRLRSSYAAKSNSGLVKNVYDAYVRAIRWASDRIKDRGIVALVTNGSYIDANNLDGLRKCLVEDFTSLYCFNLRGNQRTSGEQSRKEGGKIFGSGSRATIAIALLVRNPERTGPCALYYHDIGDYLSREDKLQRLADAGDIKSIDWRRITPNSAGDWINQRDPAFDSFLPLGAKRSAVDNLMFDIHSQGVLTARDAWAYNFSRTQLASSMRALIAFYGEQLTAYKRLCKESNSNPPDLESFISTDSKKISWTRSLKRDLSRLKRHSFNETSIVKSQYRPFAKQWLYFDRRFNEMVYKVPSLFPTPRHTNLVIAVTGAGANKPFSSLISDTIPDYELISKGRLFPMYWYSQTGAEGDSDLFIGEPGDNYRRHDAISDKTLADFRKRYGETEIIKEDIFYYVYAIFHSPEYKTRFASNLRKMLPRVPYAKDFFAFSKVGRELAKWHVDYETVRPYALQQHSNALALNPKEQYKVEKMAFGRTDGKIDRSIIVYNSHVTLSGVPPEAYEYEVNGKSAVEWLMDRYKITVDKNSGIRNDPNDWSDDPEYILKLVKRIVRVSVETVRIVKSLPELGV